MQVNLDIFNPDWQPAYERERTLINALLSDVNAQIEHIGSTAVEGLIAKPIIDVLVGLSDFSRADWLVPLFTARGYQYYPQYEADMPFRRFFTKSRDGVRTHNIHMVEIDSQFWRRHLLFRNYLRHNPDAMRRYAELKSALAEREWQDTNQYADAKTEFIRAMEAEARANLVTP